MSTSVADGARGTKVQHPVASSFADKQRARWQTGILLAFLISSLAVYIVLILVAPQLDHPGGPFLIAWGGAFFLYFAVCLWIMRTRPLRGRSYLIEMGLIFAGALIFRVMLLPLPLGLSRDAWRYLWDGRLILHGINPYLYAPTDKILLPLRDKIIFPNTPYGATPTVYPPAAQFFFALGSLLMPTNLLATKALFVLCDLITCLGVVRLLARRGMDPRRSALYAWCPLPIVEFAVQGHVDAVVIMFTVLTFVCASGSWRGARVMAGVCLGLATLAKLYPLILLVVLVRKREWLLPAACALTILLGYLPFIVTSHGHLFAAPLASVGQLNMRPAILPLLLFILEGYLHVHWIADTLAIKLLSAGLLLPLFFVVVVQRLRRRLSTEMAALVLIGGLMLTSAQINPWYLAALLPWLTLLLGPIWRGRRLQVRGLVLAAIWYLNFALILCYLGAPPVHLPAALWLLSFGANFSVVLLGWMVAWLLWRLSQKLE